MTFNQVIAQSYRTPVSVEQQQDRATQRLAAAMLAIDGIDLWTHPEAAELHAKFYDAVAVYGEWFV